LEFLQDGVVLGADTRATAGQIVCDKNCEKIHDLSPNISCCGAGTSADTENLTGRFTPSSPLPIQWQNHHTQLQVISIMETFSPLDTMHFFCSFSFSSWHILLLVY
jgi:20S proteasome subunit beta 2